MDNITLYVSLFKLFTILIFAALQGTSSNRRDYRYLRSKTWIAKSSVRKVFYSNMHVLVPIEGAGAQNNMGLDTLMNMFSGLGLGAGGLNVPNTPNCTPPHC